MVDSEQQPIDIEATPSVMADLEEIEQILIHMREKESTIYARNEFGNDSVAMWRRMLVEWMYFVVDHCDLQRQSVAGAAFFLDVAMARGLCVTSVDHQLAAATSLQLALKTFDKSVIKVEKLVKLGRGVFTEDDVARMEMKIVLSMNWYLHPISVYCFLTQYERLLPDGISATTKEMIGEVNQLVAELSVSDELYINCPPSIIAYAAMLIAMEMIESEEALPNQLQECFIIRMSTVGHLEYHSPVVLELFDSLSEKLEHSKKLHAMMQSIDAKTKKFIDRCTPYHVESLDKNGCTGKGIDVAGKREVAVGMHHSPRDVKLRLGSSSLSNSSHSIACSMGSASSS